MHDRGLLLQRFVLLMAVVVTATPFSQAASPAAAWRVDVTGGREEGLRLLDGGDGQVVWVSRGNAAGATTKSGAEPPSSYLYFAIASNRGVDISKPIYVTLEYYDGTPGGNIGLQYDSSAGDGAAEKYKSAEEQWGGWFSGGKVWRTGVYALRQAGLTHRQNLGADFRISSARLVVRSVRVSNERPADLEKLSRMTVCNMVSEARIGAGRRMIVGGFDPDSADAAIAQTRILDTTLPVLKSIGVTSHEGYVRWNLCEPEPGVYDWSVYDRYVETYKRYGMKWTPFLIVGSAYSLPDWFHKKEGFQGYVCLEHGEESDVASLWNPALRGHLARFVEAFFAHYRDSGLIESVLLGITGNYGEAIYVASGNDWTAGTHGDYHTHSGLWAGDPLAVADFQRWLTEKYGDGAVLGAAWGIPATDIATITPFTRDKAPNDRAWLDFCRWYIGSMNGYCRFWLENIRKHWRGPFEICTGGHAPAEHGADFGAQCKIAAEFGGGVRITNEGSDYRANFSLTRWVASASRQYGATFSFEPAGMVDTNGVVARIYNATTSGALGLHYYYPNLFAEEAARANWVRWASQWRLRTPRTEIAVYYPETHILLNGNKFLERVQPLRDAFDFAYQSDQQILDGGLKDVKALILLWGNTSEKVVWTAIGEWVRQGGLLLYADALGRLRTVEGDESFQEALFGPQALLGCGRVAQYAGKDDQQGYRRFLSETLKTAPELSRATRAMVMADGVEDHVFASVTGSNRLLWLNYTAHPVRKAGRLLPAYAINETGLR